MAYKKNGGILLTVFSMAAAAYTAYHCGHALKWGMEQIMDQDSIAYISPRQTKDPHKDQHCNPAVCYNRYHP